MQTFEQPSPLTKLLSSHSSGDSFIPLPQSAQILVPEQLPLQPSEHICPVQVFTAQEQFGIHFVPEQVPPQPSEHVDPIGVLTAQTQLGTHLVPAQVPPQPSEHVDPIGVLTAQTQLGTHLVPAQVPPQPSEHVDPIGVLTAQAQLGTQATQMKEQPYAEISFVKFGLNTLCVARFPSPNLPSTPCPQHNTLESFARIPQV